MWSIVGHEWAVELLVRAILTNKLGHAYLVAGPPQVGKRTLVKAFAQAINCGAESFPCGECRHCQLIQEDKHPDVCTVEPENDRIKIEAIRKMQRSVVLSPVEARYRVCIISQIDQATTSAANCLLKTLEEPPPRVVLILTADGTESLLPTIVSRCQVISLRLLPTRQIVSALQKRGLGDEQSHLLGHLARGKIGWAIAASEDRRVLAHRDEVLRKLTEAGEWRYASRFAWAEQLSRKPAQVGTVLDVLASWWRDVLLVASGSVAQITNVDRASMLHRWADRHGTMAAQKALSDIRDTVWRLEHNANLRLALEVLMLELPAGL